MIEISGVIVVVDVFYIAPLHIYAGGGDVKVCSIFIFK